MRRLQGFGVAVATLALTAQAAIAQEAVNKVAGGGVAVAGWTGKIDASRENTGLTLNDGKLASMGKDLHVVTGPAVTYWNPANKATGDYTVKAKFTEPKFQGLNSHPHPYGIMIAGNDLGTDSQSLLYCSAYGSGKFIVRGFGPTAFALNGGGGAADAAVNKVAPGEQVTQEIALSVKGDKVECAINGKTVATYSKADLVSAGKLKSTDGVWGIRFGHNTEAMVTGLTMTKP